MDHLAMPVWEKTDILAPSKYRNMEGMIDIDEFNPWLIVSPKGERFFAMDHLIWFDINKNKLIKKPVDTKETMSSSFYYFGWTAEKLNITFSDDKEKTNYKYLLLMKDRLEKNIEFIESSPRLQAMNKDYLIILNKLSKEVQKL